ncbi:metal-dependent transcriptional regulator [Corynebacterium epidermidicanis]|uniref:Diphtheria toxin repressor n=1 Tax=Corynebacterium epidermidicanis TaxID=1050174 RepID=A0A0G3GWU3_9CORY|nr:metal-dependent transcriptional regulator [Corynebacterium epidermidicanis]AKK03317.1 iron (metal) dependent repressor, DtxR family [Corynebacterium epidermidicanis]
MKDLVDTTEMYLRTIYELEEEGITPLRARIAERLEQSGPTVSQTVARMERDGLVTVAGDRSLKMTPTGRTLAIAVMRKHRLAERLLTDVIGLDISKVHAEACRWEHVMSDEVEKRLVDVLDNFQTSPFGNPIPGLNELGVEKPEADFGSRLVDLPAGQEITGVVTQINEIIQVDEDLVCALRDAGVRLGSTITVSANQGHTLLLCGEKCVSIPEDLAHAVRIAPIKK